jgi:hypothetical protein
MTVLGKTRAHPFDTRYRQYPATQTKPTPRGIERPGNPKQLPAEAVDPAPRSTGLTYFGDDRVLRRSWWMRRPFPSDRLFRNVDDPGAESSNVAQYGAFDATRLDIKMLESTHRKTQEDGPMDIPNDLNKLLARLKEVTTDTTRTPEAWASGPRPSAVEIDFFLAQYHFDADAEIEPIEISRDGVFEFYLFAVSNRRNDDLLLLAMWPKLKSPDDRGGTLYGE